MTKVCIICDDKAGFVIKNTKDYYCEECATEQFGDLSYLLKVEEQNKEQANSIGQPEENLLTEEEYKDQ